MVTLQEVNLDFSNTKDVSSLIGTVISTLRVGQKN